MSPVQFVQVTVNVPKQADDVLKLFVDLAAVIRQGKDYSSLVTDLVAAIDGVAEIPTEGKEATWELVNCAALRAVEIVKALTAPKSVPVVHPVGPA